ncbi:MAG: nuclear transport factor 2 family protein [Nitrospira sp.]|nr:nuclear transport factor 2 family protein [Nitrospira sp.]MCP9441586.1 nuclear transport factor 2 family protein [Nitrospira sp.]
MLGVQERAVSSWLLVAGWVALFACSLSGCSSKKPLQHPEDHERIQRIDQAVEALREAYQEKNVSSFRSLLQPDAQLNQLQREVEADFETFDSIKLDFTIERVIIEGSDVDVYVHWQGAWKKRGEEAGVRHRGSARLQWTGHGSVLLRGVQGDLPFGMKAKQTLSESPPQFVPR